MNGVYDCASHHGALDLDTDVVIVGSGASGAVMAKELSDAGFGVIILEEGSNRHSLGDMRPSEVLRHAFRDGGLSVAFGIGDTPMINLMAGRGIGGSSLLTGGVCFRTPESVLDEWATDLGLHDLSPANLEPYFEEVERALHVEEVPTSMRSLSTQAFDRGATRLGYPLKSLCRNTKGCIGASRCNFVCPHGAKLSVDLNYLPKAIQQGARIYSSCLVERVEFSGDRAIGISGRLLNGLNGAPAGALRVQARRVILACGAMYTPLILQRSGVGRQSKQLGRNLTLHPGFRVFGRFLEPVDSWKGALQSAFTDAFEHEGMLLIDIGLPPGILPVFMPGAGAEHRWRASRASHVATFGGMLHDEARGRVRTGLGREPFVTYHMSPRDRARVPKLIHRLTDTFFAAGAKEVYLPILGHPPVDSHGYGDLDIDHIHGRHFECGSQHPLGTCRMGQSPRHSVLSPTGQVWGTRELYVADGSAIPTSLGVNPQITIMALATLRARRLRETPFEI